jgi:hypothetical protein
VVQIMHGTYRLWHFHLLTDTNIHSDTQAEPRKLSSLTLYIDLWQEGKPAPGQNPPVISPPVVIFRRIGVRAEIRTQNPVLSNTRLAKMVPLSHLRRLLDNIFIYSMTTIRSMTNFGHFADFSRINGILILILASQSFFPAVALFIFFITS